MASVKLAVVLVVVVCAALAATPAFGYPPESCTTQAGYFTNCLRRGLGERCCGLSQAKCLCLLKQEMQIRCVPKRSCPVNGADARNVKLAEMGLSCMKNLRCKRA